MATETVEQREIRGVNLRIVVAIIVSTITITSAVIGTYYGVINRIDKVVIEEATQRQAILNRIEKIDTQASMERTQIREDIRELRIRLRSLEKKVFPNGPDYFDK